MALSLAVSGAYRGLVRGLDKGDEEGSDVGLKGGGGGGAGERGGARGEWPIPGGVMAKIYKRDRCALDASDKNPNSSASLWEG